MRRLYQVVPFAPWRQFCLEHASTKMHQILSVPDKIWKEKCTVNVLINVWELVYLSRFTHYIILALDDSLKSPDPIRPSLSISIIPNYEMPSDANAPPRFPQHMAEKFAKVCCSWLGCFIFLAPRSYVGVEQLWRDEPGSGVTESAECVHSFHPRPLTLLRSLRKLKKNK